MAKKLKVETICERELLERILRIVERQEKLPSANKVAAHCLYDNKSLMAKLGIKEKYLKNCGTTDISAIPVKVTNIGTLRKMLTVSYVTSILMLLQ